MKKLFALSAVALLTLCAQAADVLFPLQYFTTEPFASNRIVITPTNMPAINGSAIIMAEPRIYTNDGSGSLIVSNMVGPVLYYVDCFGKLSHTTVRINLPDTNGFVNAKDYITTNNIAPTLPGGGVSYVTQKNGVMLSPPTLTGSFVGDGSGLTGVPMSSAPIRDNSSVLSIDPNARKLYLNNTTATLDYGNRSFSGNWQCSGTLTAANLAGNGAGITGGDASTIVSSGVFSPARIPDLSGVYLSLAGGSLNNGAAIIFHDQFGNDVSVSVNSAGALVFDSIANSWGAHTYIDNNGLHGPVEGYLPTAGGFLDGTITVSGIRHALFTDGSLSFTIDNDADPGWHFEGSERVTSDGGFYAPAGDISTATGNIQTGGTFIGNGSGLTASSVPLGSLNRSGLSASKMLATDASKNLVSTTTGYLITGLATGNSSPAVSTTYYVGGAPVKSTLTSYSSAQLDIPVAGTITRVFYKVEISGSADTSEANGVQHFIRVNNSSDIGGATFAYTQTTNKIVSGLSQAVSAGDTLALKWVTPSAFTVAPTSVHFWFQVFISTP